MQSIVSTTKETMGAELMDTMTSMANNSDDGNHLINLIKTFISKVVCNSDVLHIVRPFVYLLLIAKHGKKSWYPMLVSLAMDCVITFLVFLKLIGTQKLRSIERRDLY